MFSPLPPSEICGSPAPAPSEAPARAAGWRIVVLALTLVGFAGCGTGTYKERAAERLAELRMKSNFLGMLDRDAYEISDPQANMLGVKLRLPKGFVSKGQPLRTGYTETGRSEKTTTTLDATGKVVDVRKEIVRNSEYVVPEARVQPPFVKFRDFCMSYETFYRTIPKDWKNPDLPVYGYFAVTRVTTPEGETVEQQEILNEIQQAVVKALADEGTAAAAGETESGEGDPQANSPFPWETVQLPTPEGGNIECKRLQATGKQLFDAVSMGGDNGLHDGKFDVYVHSDDTYHIVVAWRAPLKIENRVHLMEAGACCVGTLTVNPPPPPAADDTDSGADAPTTAS